MTVRSKLRKVSAPVLVPTMLGVSLAVVAQDDADAWVFGDCYWHSLPVEIQNDGHGTYKDGTYYDAWDNSQWSWDYLTDVSFEPAGAPANDDIHLWQSDWGNVSWRGQSYQACVGDSISYADARLNRYWTDGYTFAQVRNIALHEIGHALGLEHTPDWKGCVGVMKEFNAWDCGFTVPQQDDRDGINAVY